MTAGQKVLEIQVSGDNRGQNQDEGGRVHLAMQQPAGQRRPGNEVTARVRKARPTLGSAQSYTEQKKMCLFEQGDLSVSA